MAGARTLAVAAGLRLGVPGLDILWGRPTVGPGSDLLPVTELALVPGAAVPLDEARTMEPPRILVPTTLPTPETAFVDESGDVRVISLAWRAPPGMPGIDGSDLGLVLMAAPGRIEAPFLTKVLGEGSTIEPLSVGADPGWWISGASHELLVVGTDGGVDVMRSRFAGDTLVFARDGSVYRLESVLGRDRTLEIATSLR